MPRVILVQYRGHTWVYRFLDEQRTETLQRVHADSRDPECGFGLAQMLLAIRDIKGGKA